MKLTDALLGEHGVIHALFAHVRRALAGAPTAEAARALAGVVDTALRSHAKLEDELLFPLLERAIGAGGPLEVMRAEHQEIEQALDEALAATEPGAIAAALRDAIEVAVPHFQKEEMVLFRLAQRALPGPELERLGAEWARLRGVVLADEPATPMRLHPT